MSNLTAFLIGGLVGFLSLLLVLIGFIIYICVKSAKDATEPPDVEFDSSFPKGGIDEQDV